jgi:predicted ATPase
MSEAGKSPFSCPIPENIKTLDRKHSLIYFKDYADAFKNEIEFYLPKFTLFIGPNNSGKSTLNSWFKLLQSGWKNLDPVPNENKTFEKQLKKLLGNMNWKM